MKINKLLGLVATSTVVSAPLCIVSCAKEETKTWNVSFDTRCETFIDTIRVEDGGSIQEPTQPVKEGWTFGGWFDNEDCTGEPYVFGTAITDNIILHAKWENGPVKPIQGDKISITKTEEEFDSETRIASFKFEFNEVKNGTEIECSLPESTSQSIALKSRKATVLDNTFKISLVYAGRPSNADTVEFGLHFTYTINNQPYYEDVDGLKATYNGETPITEDFIYLYNGSSVLFGQTGYSGSDNKEWKCYYFKDKEATAGKDITADTKFSFKCNSEHIKFEENSNVLSWDNSISQGIYWGNVNATWTDAKGNTYTAISSEIAVAICDFALYNQKIWDAGYEDQCDTLGHFSSGWKIKIGDGLLDKEVSSEDNIDIDADTTTNKQFEWSNMYRRINAKDTTPVGDYTLKLKIHYTYMGCNFEYTTPTLKLHRIKN